MFYFQKGQQLTITIFEGFYDIDADNTLKNIKAHYHSDDPLPIGGIEPRLRIKEILEQDNDGVFIIRVRGVLV